MLFVNILQMLTLYQHQQKDAKMKKNIENKKTYICCPKCDHRFSSENFEGNDMERKKVYILDYVLKKGRGGVAERDLQMDVHPYRILKKPDRHKILNLLMDEGKLLSFHPHGKRSPRFYHADIFMEKS